MTTENKTLFIKWQKEYVDIESKEDKKAYFLNKRDELNSLINNYIVKRAVLYMFINKTYFNKDDEL